MLRNHHNVIILRAFSEFRATRLLPGFVLIFMVLYCMIFRCVPAEAAAFGPQPAEVEIQVTIQPQDAVTAGAMWRIAGTTTWFNSGDSAFVYYYGQVTVEFKALSGWVAPAAKTISVSQDIIYQVAGTYVRAGTGRLTVNILPSAAALTAKWRIRELNSGAFPYSSGQTITLPFGTWSIEFKPMRGFLTPNSKPVNITSTDLKTVQASYAELIVGRIKVVADSMSRTGNNFTASGKCRLAFQKPSSGYTGELIAVTGSLSGTIDPPVIRGNGEISVSGTNQSIPVFANAAFFRGSFTLNAQTLEAQNLDFEASVKFMGFKFDVHRFQLSPDPFFLSLGVDLIMPTSVFTPGGYVQINRLELQRGQPPVVIGKARLNDCNIFDWIVINDTYLSFDSTTQSLAVNAGLVQLDDLLPPLSGAFRLENGKLAQLMIAVYDADLQFVKSVPLYLQDLGMDLRNPASKQGSVAVNIRFTVLPNDIALAEAEGRVNISFNGEIDGNLRSHTMLGFQSSSSHIHFIPNRSFATTFSGNYAWGLVRMNGSSLVTWNPRFTFSGNGNGTVGYTVPKWLRIFVKKKMVGDYYYIAGATVGLDRKGFDATVKILHFVPMKIHFNPARTMSGMSADAESTTLPVEVGTLGSGFAAQSKTYVVQESNPAVIFTGIGASAVPELVLILPDGSRLDPAGQLPQEGRNFMYREDEDESSASFLIGKPMAGVWTVDLRNSSEAGATEIYFFRSNSDPQIITDKVEKVSDRYHRVYLRAYDPDDKADVNLYWDSDNSGFNGVKVESATEKDGPLVFDWEAGEDLGNSGFLYAEIDDGKNPPVRTYFDGRIDLEPCQLPKPRLASRKVKGDALVLRVKMPDPSPAAAFKVYYSSNLQQKVLKDYALAQAGSEIVLEGGPIKPGRRYQLRVAAMDAAGAETEMSNIKKIKYRAKAGNNHPFFASTPVTEAFAGSEYVYPFQAVDWDGNSLSFVLRSGPEGMVLDASSHSLRWTPEEADVGDNFVSIEVSDGNGGSDIQDYTLQVSTAETPTVTADAIFFETDIGTELMVQIVDAVADNDSSVPDEIEATLADPTGFGELSLVLRETSADSGIFRGCVSSSQAGESLPYWLLLRPMDTVNRSGQNLVVSWKAGEETTRRVRTILD